MLASILCCNHRSSSQRLDARKFVGGYTEEFTGNHLESPVSRHLVQAGLLQARDHFHDFMTNPGCMFFLNLLTPPKNLVYWSSDIFPSRQT